MYCQAYVQRSFVFMGFWHIGHIKLPLPNLFKRIVPEEISSDLSLEVAKPGFIGNATVLQFLPKQSLF